MFANIASIESMQVEPIAGVARTFTVPATPSKQGDSILRVPGLKRVYKVFLGKMELPEFQGFSFPKGITDEEFKNKVYVEWPVYKLDKAEDGSEALLRAEWSNDGKWQEGVPITIYGDWEDEKAKAGK